MTVAIGLTGGGLERSASASRLNHAIHPIRNPLRTCTWYGALEATQANADFTSTARPASAECPELVDSGPYGMPGERSASVPRRTRNREKPARLTAFSALATHRRGVSLSVSISIPADAL